jgi:ankyrin repeat protein
MRVGEERMSRSIINNVVLGAFALGLSSCDKGDRVTHVHSAEAVERFFDAVGDGNLAVVAELCDAGMSPNTFLTGDRGMDFNGFTPLMEAARQGQGEMVQLLLARGADHDMQTESGKSPLHWAAMSGNLQVVEYLLAAGSDVNLQDSAGATPLSKGARNPAVIRALLDEGADPNLKGFDGSTPLMPAVLNADSLRLLIDAGANVIETNEEGKSALHYAAIEGNAESISELLAHGADVECGDNQGQTPLLCAVSSGNVSNVTALLDAGADPMATNANGQSSLDLAKKRVAATNGGLRTDVEVLKYLEEWLAAHPTNR